MRPTSSMRSSPVVTSNRIVSLDMPLVGGMSRSETFGSLPAPSLVASHRSSASRVAARSRVEVFGRSMCSPRAESVDSEAEASKDGAMSFVTVEKPRPHISLVTLNRPERMNAMAFDVMIPLKDTLEEISHDNDTRVVVVTGAGHGFCAGADLEDSGHVPNIDGLTRPTIGRRAMEVLDDVIVG